MVCGVLSMALAADFDSAKIQKPNPLDPPVLGSLITITLLISPNCSKYFFKSSTDYTNINTFCCCCSYTSNKYLTKI